MVTVVTAMTAICREILIRLLAASARCRMTSRTRPVGHALGARGQQGSRGQSATDAPLQSGPALALKTYIEKPNDQRLAWLTKAVLRAQGLDTAAWRGIRRRGEGRGRRSGESPGRLRLRGVPVTLRRLVVTFKPGQFVLHTLYRTTTAPSRA